MKEKVIDELVRECIGGKKCKWDETTVEDLFRAITTERLSRIEEIYQ